MLELIFLKHCSQLTTFLSSWLGDKLHHNEFDKDNGSKQELLFGKCINYIPGGAPLIRPSSKPSLQPSSKPSLQSSSEPSYNCERYTCGDCTLACDRITNNVALSQAYKKLTCDVANCCQWKDSECTPVAECGCSL